MVIIAVGWLRLVASAVGFVKQQQLDSKLVVLEAVTGLRVEAQPLGSVLQHL